MATEFGPTAIATPANAITVARIVVSPVLWWMVLDSAASWPAVTFWIVLAVSDGIDGHLARKHGTTRSGAFLDPLADKILVLGTMFVLVADGTFWWLPVVLIAVREAAVSLYRSVLAQRGISLPARMSGKVKTVVQEVAIGFALLPLTADASWVATSVLWLSVAAAMYSAGEYLLDARRQGAAVAVAARDLAD